MGVGIPEGLQVSAEFESSSSLARSVHEIFLCLPDSTHKQTQSSPKTRFSAERTAIFPVEVFDLIIDQVPVFQHRDLGACSVICRTWAQHSRSRQFKSLKFTSSSSLRQFLDLVSSPNTTIAPHVREVIFDIGAGDHHMTTPLLMRITSLRALESISLDLDGCLSNRIDLPRAEEITAWLGSFANLKRIELSQFTFDSFSQLRDMVCVCPGLKLLFIYRCRSRPRGPLLEQHSLPETQIPPCPPLRALRTVNCEFEEELFKWVAVGASSSPLKSICIGFDTFVRHQAALGQLLRALGPTLEQLSIRYDPGYDSFNSIRDASISYAQIDLTHNTRLEVLSFWNLPSTIIQHNGLFMIKQISSSSFRELNVSLHRSIWRFLRFGPLLPVRPESLPELAAIDMLLQRPSFSNLEAFNLGLPSVVDSIQEFFPRTAARGRLRIMSASDVQQLHVLRNGEGGVWTWPLWEADDVPKSLCLLNSYCLVPATFTKFDVQHTRY